MSGPSPSAAKPMDTYRRLLGYLRHYKGWFALGMLGSVMYASVGGLLAVFTKEFMDRTFLERDPLILKLAPVGAVLIFLLRGGGEFIQMYFMGQVGRRIVKRMREQIFDRYLDLPIEYYDRSNSADMLSRLLFNTEQLAQAATESVSVIIRESLTVVGLVVSIFLINAKFTLIALCIAPPIVLLVQRANHYLRRYSQRIQNSMVDITRVAKEAIDAPRVIRVFNAQEYERGQFAEVNERNRRSAMKLIFARGLSSPVVQVIAALGLAVVLYLATEQAVAGKLTQGEFFGVIGGLLLMNQPVRTLVSVAAPLQQGIAASASIFELLDEQVEVQSGTRITERVRGTVEYRNVGFQYKTAQREALKDIGLKIQPGEVVAFVGKSGSGKSTLVNLLPRFYDVNCGSVLIDGHDIRDYTLASLRDQIALVSQEVVLFNDTIRANIAFGREVDAAAIERAARAAHVLEFANEKSAGLDTEVGDRGAMLSGGQKQRISIARALLKDAPILILDEATSALDTESERAIQSALDELMKNRTTLVIAHRLSTIEKANRIVVMHEGAIVEIGTHAELLAKDGRYATLYRMQFND